MGERRMNYLRLPHRMFNSAAVVMAGNAAFGVWVRAVMWSTQYTEDFHVPKVVVTKMFGPRRHWTLLQKEGLARTDGNGGYFCILPEVARVEMGSRTVAPGLRKAVIARDGMICTICTAPVSSKNLHLDHVRPWTKGGPTTLENLRVTCRRCNIRKSNHHDERAG